MKQRIKDLGINFRGVLVRHYTEQVEFESKSKQRLLWTHYVVLRSWTKTTSKAVSLRTNSSRQRFVRSLLQRNWCRNPKMKYPFTSNSLSCLFTSTLVVGKFLQFVRKITLSYWFINRPCTRMILPKYSFDVTYGSLSELMLSELLETSCFDHETRCFWDSSRGL